MPADDGAKEKETTKEEAAAAGKAAAAAAGKVSLGTKNKQENRVKKDPKEPRGVVYLGHLPSGFFEPQMREFLAQFGTVTRLRLSRTKKNAHSKGYAFVEFEDEEVAQIVAETMDKYLLFGRQLVAHIVPAEKRHPALFRGANKRMMPLDRKRKSLQRLQHNKKRGDDRADDDAAVPLVTVRQHSRRLKKEKRKRGVLAGLGIDYDFDGWEEAPAAAASSSTPKKKVASSSTGSGSGSATKKKSKLAASSAAAAAGADAGSKKRPAPPVPAVGLAKKKLKKKA